MSSALLIAGMHRSGTSAVAGAVARLGVPLGDRLIAGDPRDNPEGFYEHADIVAAHEALAAAHGRTWDDPRPTVEPIDRSYRAALAEAVSPILDRDFDDAPLWALKDPRLCRFLPAWLDLLDRRQVEARLLAVHRSPAEVAASLARRNGFSAEKSSVLWLDHELSLRRSLPGRPHSHLRFADLVADPVAVLERCGEELGIEWPVAPAEAAEKLREFIRPEHRHHRGTPGGRESDGGPLTGLAERVWKELTETGDEPKASDVEAWTTALAELTRDLSPLAFEHATQVAQRAAHDSAWHAESSLRGDLSRSREALESLVATIERDVRTLSDNLESRTEDVGAHARDLDSLRRRAAELTDGSQRLADSVSVLAAEVARHSAEIAKQGEIVTALAAERQAGDMALEEGVRDLRDNLTDLRRSLQESRTVRSALARRLDLVERRSFGLAVRRWGRKLLRRDPSGR